VAPTAIADTPEVAKKVLTTVFEVVKPNMGSVQRFFVERELPGILKQLDAATIEERAEMYELLIRIHGMIEEGLGLNQTQNTREAPRRRAAAPDFQHTGPYDPQRRA
jgi:hypothetical protein